MNDLTIYITLGNGQALGLNEHDEIVLFETKQRVITNYVPLGKLTKHRIQVLKETLDALAIHATE